LTLLCTVSLNYKPHSAITDLHTFQFTVAHALGFSVSTSRILETDFNTDTITSNHYEVFSPFLIQTSWTTDSLNSDVRQLNLQFDLQSDLDLSCKHNLVKHNRSLKVAVQRLDFMAHPLYIHSLWLDPMENTSIAQQRMSYCCHARLNRKVFTAHCLTMAVLLLLRPNYGTVFTRVVA
jgi:hypothetical protein